MATIDDSTSVNLADQSLRTLRVCTTCSAHAAAVARLFSDRHQLQWNFVVADDDDQPFRNYLQVMAAYENGDCDAVVGRHSVLQKYSRDNSSKIVLISQSNLVPLGLNYVTPHVVAVSNTDEHWEDIVSHAIWSTMDADVRGFDSQSEELYQRHSLWKSLGLDSANSGNW